jgi:tetratricopeptide (TPR) repeat protein
MRNIVAAFLAASLGIGAAAAEKYEAPEMEKIDPADLATFKEAYTFYLEGVEYERAESWTSASQAYRQAIKIYPNYADAQYGFGRMAVRLGRLDDAEEALKTALALDPELYAAHSELGNVHYQRGEYNKAAYEFQEVLKNDPNDAVARYNLGNALRNLGKPDKALAQYEKAFALEPENIDILFNMALAYEDAGKNEEAVAYFEKFIAAAKDDPDEAEWVQRAKEYIQELREGGKGSK